VGRIKVGDNLPKPQAADVRAGFTAVAKLRNPASTPTTTPIQGAQFVSLPEPPMPKTAMGANAAMLFAKNSK